MPEPALSLDDALNVSLHALLQDRRTLEECLAAYPQYAADLKPLLQTALLTRRLKKPVLNEDRVAALEERLMQAFPAAPALDETTPRRMARPSKTLFPAWMGRTAAIMLLVFLATLGTGGTTVAASANSVPGETLYSVKRAWEDIIVFFASLIGRTGDVWLHLAHVRWDELHTLAERQQPITTQEWQSFIQTVKMTLEKTPQSRADVVAVLAAAQTHMQTWPTPNATYNADLLLILTLSQSTNADIVSNPVATATSATLMLPAVAATVRDVNPPTLTLSIPFTSVPVITTQSAPTNTPTRTPTPSRTPTLTPTPTQTSTPFKPLPSATATYTRLPLLIPSQVIVLPTQPGSNSIPVTYGPNIPPILPTVSQGGGDIDPPYVPPDGTIDPVIRPTMRAVYATQTAIAAGVEKSATPSNP